MGGGVFGVVLLLLLPLIAVLSVDSFGPLTDRPLSTTRCMDTKGYVSSRGPRVLFKWQGADLVEVKDSTRISVLGWGMRCSDRGQEVHCRGSAYRSTGLSIFLRHAAQRRSGQNQVVGDQSAELGVLAACPTWLPQLLAAAKSLLYA